MNDIVKIIFLSITSELVLFALSKFMGNKEMSQMSLFDYVVGITIGSIAAEMATALESDFLQPLVAMIVYALVAVGISWICIKSQKARRFVYGNSLVLLNNGQLYKKNFESAKLDLNEFLMQCRINGYFNLSDIDTAIIESNGKISFLPKSDKRPTNPSDFDIETSPSTIEINVILDGKLLHENLMNSGYDEIWLQKKLVSQGFEKPDNIFLATLNRAGNLCVYEKCEMENKHDYWE